MVYHWLNSTTWGVSMLSRYSEGTFKEMNVTFSHIDSEWDWIWTGNYPKGKITFWTITTKGKVCTTFQWFRFPYSRGSWTAIISRLRDARSHKCKSTGSIGAHNFYTILVSGGRGQKIKILIIGRSCCWRCCRIGKWIDLNSIRVTWRRTELRC